MLDVTVIYQIVPLNSIHNAPWVECSSLQFSVFCYITDWFPRHLPNWLPFIQTLYLPGKEVGEQGLGSGHITRTGQSSDQILTLHNWLLASVSTADPATGTVLLVPLPTLVLLEPEVDVGCGCTKNSPDLDIKPAWPNLITTYLRHCRACVSVTTVVNSVQHSEYVYWFR